GGAVQLVLPVPGEHRHPAGGNDLHAVLRPEPEGQGLPLEHDAADSPLPVLHGKIVVARAICFAVVYLSPNIQGGQFPVPVQQGFDILVDLGKRVNGAHVRSPDFTALQVRMAVPMALSVENRGWANTAPRGSITCRNRELEATPPEHSTGRP